METYGPRQAFLEAIKASRCLVCGRPGVDMAHVRPWSRKLGRFTRRTHKGHGWYYAVPLCREHHLEQERNPDFFQRRGLDPYAEIFSALNALFPQCARGKVAGDNVGETIEDVLDCVDRLPDSETAAVYLSTKPLSSIEERLYNALKEAHPRAWIDAYAVVRQAEAHLGRLLRDVEPPTGDEQLREELGI